MIQQCPRSLYPKPINSPTGAPWHQLLLYCHVRTVLCQSRHDNLRYVTLVVYNNVITWLYRSRYVTLVIVYTSGHRRVTNNCLN